MLEDGRQKAEDRRQKTGLFCFLFFVMAILILGGCAAQIQKPVRVCPGKESIAESLSSLRLQLENAVPLKANGQCLLQYYAEDRKPKKENFPVKLWVNPVRSPHQQGVDVRRLTSNGVNPPVEIYMQGDVAFDPKGIVLGSNEDEFWLAVRLKEVSSYWWGRWSEESRPEKLMISPRLVLEALGIAAVGDEESWSLSNEGAFDVLTKQEGDTKTKKIYINRCDYLVRKIEYFDVNGQVAAVAELDKYKEISKNFFVPSIVKIVSRTDGNEKDSVQITLSSVKPANFTDKQRKRLFIRPQEQGFKHIYKIVDGNIIEQPHN
jgi:hypothetical protein